TISATTASCTTSALGSGTVTLLATYSGDTTHAKAQRSFSVTVSWTTRTTLTSTPTASPYGQPVTLLATVSAGVGVPTGTVSFHLGSPTGQALTGCATVPLGSSGVATCSTSALPIGSDTIYAVYAPLTGQPYAASTSKVTVSVSPAPTTTTVTASPSTAVAGQLVTLTAAVVGQSPTGTVTFSAGSTTLCTATVTGSTAVCTTTRLPVGTDSVTATYSGDTTNEGSSASTNVQVLPGLRSCDSNGSDCRSWLLSDPSPAGVIEIRPGNSKHVTILYSGFTQLAEGTASGPFVEVFSKGNLVGVLPVTVTTPFWFGSVAVLGFTLPGTLASGSYTVQLTAYATNGEWAQYVWQVKVER
ncbi:MAG: Ig-like domain-containing protein, partial [Acidimicrobiales bacterium]